MATPSTKVSASRRCDRAPGLERERRPGTLGPDSNDLGAAAEQVADSDVGAKPGALTDRHVDHVEVRSLLVQLGRVGRDAGDQVTVERRHQMQTVPTASRIACSRAS